MMSSRLYFLVLVIFGYQPNCISFLLGDDKACFDGLGCFSLRSPWTSLLRPFPAPTNPSNLTITFYLTTRDASRIPFQVWPEIKVENGTFSGSRNATVFVIHGYLSDSKTPWVDEITKSYLDNEDANVFEVDWGILARKVVYFQAASNTRVVGAIIARFLHYLIENEELDLNRTHLIGHSLGAHVAGYTAKDFGQSLIGRITALDPAQPGFEGTRPEVRVDKTDALFVDVVHSDAVPLVPFGGFGIMEPVGHVDFYINGGARQPGCLAPKIPDMTSINVIGSTLMETLSSWVSCSHSRAIQVFYKSLSKCNYVGFKINKVNQFLNSLSAGLSFSFKNLFFEVGCDQDTDCAVLSLKTPLSKSRGAFGVITTSREPYCSDNKSQVIFKRILGRAGRRIAALKEKLSFMTNL